MAKFFLGAVLACMRCAVGNKRVSARLCVWAWECQHSSEAQKPLYYPQAARKVR